MKEGEGHQECGDTQGDSDIEDGAPVQKVQEESADDGTGNETEGHGDPEQPESLAEIRCRKRLGDDGRAARYGHGGAHGLKGAEENQVPDGPGKGTGSQPEGEHHDADQEDPFAAQHVADLSDNQHGTRAHQDEGDGHPHDHRKLGPEDTGQLGKGDIGDARVHGRHHGGRGDRDQDVPLISNHVESSLRQ